MSNISPASHLIIKGARQHNLKNVDLVLPKNKLVVFTGVSGSGKSSMAHDTIYAEGQRRYVESLSSYARQFLGVMDKPDVDQIDGLSPAILIDQKQGSHNPRSTVGTVTEIYDYLRLLYARIGHPHCPQCGREVSPQDITQIVASVIELATSHESFDKNKGMRLLVLSPIVKNQKGEFKELLPNLFKQGIQEVRIDGKFYATKNPLNLFKNNRHSIDAVIDRIVIGSVQNQTEYEKNRLVDSLEQGLNLASGEVIVSLVLDSSLSFPETPEKMEDHLFSQNLACPVCNISITLFHPRHFSFNSPDGACPNCTGLGTKLTINTQTVLAPDLNLMEGGIIPLAGQFEHQTWFANQIIKAMAKVGFTTKQPLSELNDEQRQVLFEGDGEDFAGLTAEFSRRYRETTSDWVKVELEKFMIRRICPDCNGQRLKPEVLAVTIDQQSIAEVSRLTIDAVQKFFSELSPKLSNTENSIAESIIKEISDRLKFLISVGLTYLTIDREADSLSGGELQRIRLASQIGSHLTGILYVLDEPTIGLHQRDNQKLINTLRELVALGNTLVVVEHDRQTIESADHLVEFGPQAGEKGGTVTFQGTVDEIYKSNCLTGQYLSGKKTITGRTGQIKMESPSKIILRDCTQHNLKNVDVEFPLNRFVVVTGVSGSGKSSLVVDTLYEALARKLNPLHQQQDIPFGEVMIPAEIKRVSLIDQSPIGRTPRSNPATYTKIFDYIRQAFTLTKEAQYRGYGAGRFSFNVKGGRCETCQGEGQIKIEMQFLGDIYVTCETCKGKRFNEPTLEVDYNGKNVAEILDMTIDQAAEFFKNIPIISKKLTTLQQVGLGYIKLGQPAPTLSGGEAQRVKLAAELSKTGSGHTVYILDEPTTGLHFDDLNKLIHTLFALVNQGNTVVVIEHNLDVIKNADYLIDMGPEGGNSGGEVIATGSPMDLAKNFDTPTAAELKQLY